MTPSAYSSTARPNRWSKWPPQLRPRIPPPFKSSRDAFGWSGDIQELSHFPLFIEGGRIHDLPSYDFKTALSKITTFCTDEFRLIDKQNLILANIKPMHRSRAQTILE